MTRVLMNNTVQTSPAPHPGASLSSPAESETGAGSTLARALLLVIHVLGLLPLPLRSMLGALLGALFSLLPTRERRVAMLQMRRFLGIDPSPLLIARLYAGVGRALLESFNFSPLLAPDAGHIRCDDRELLEQLRSGSRGVVALTAHLGNWDLLGAYMAAQGVRFAAIGREARNPHLQQVLASLRQRHGIRTIWRSGRAGIKAIVQELQRGGTIAALIDQDTSVTSVMTPFFGREVRTPSTLVDLGKRHGCTFITAFMVREAASGYRVHLYQIDPSLSSQEILSQYHQHLEQLVRRYPAQWVWFHKRWRGRLDGSRMSSKEYLEFLQEKSR